MAAPRLIGLVAHPEKTGAGALVHALRREFDARGVHLLLESATAAAVGEPVGTGLTVAELGERCELLIVLGGDGTILRVVRALGTRLRPMLGINLGRLGFLTCFSPADFRQAVECVLARSYRLSERTLLCAEVVRGEGPVVAVTPMSDAANAGGAAPEHHWGLNDAVISRGALSRLIQLETRIDGALLTQYSADGLIISTPTGSTAYSLSAGGPLLAPDSGVFVVTPICPHTLSNRSVIVADGACIDVRIGGGHAEIFLTVDGQRGIPLTPGDTVRVRRAPERLPLAMLPDLPFFELARRKLRWNGSNIG